MQAVVAMSNSEGYPDRTAEIAIRNVMKEQRSKNSTRLVRRKAEERGGKFGGVKTEKSNTNR